MLKRHWIIAMVLVLVAGLTLTQRASNNVGSEQSKLRGGTKLVTTSHLITVTPWGPSQDTLDNARAGLLQHPALQEFLKGTRSRLISFELLDGAKVNGSIQPPERYRADFVDYTNNLAYTATARFDNSDLKVSPLTVQPEPSDEEFKAAVEIASRDPKIGPPIASKAVDVYRPMPPLINSAMPVGKVNRTVSVGLQSNDTNIPSEIIGVDMISETVLRFPGNAPPASTAAPDACGVSSAGQSTTPRGTAGSFNVIISRNGVEIWNFIVIRPSASSGTRASGIEIQNVNYRGQRVLTRGHAPILNVEYERNLCGPYRDWTYQEDMFTANGTDAAPGIRICTDPPQTVLESGTDFGNFRGVAVYDNKEEVRLTTEMQAGWYRYLMDWTFTDGGIIRPRYGFGATINSCVCNVHNHHVYWRLDFDVVSSANTVYEVLPSGTKSVDFESMRPRLFGTNESWIIQNTGGPQSCTLTPGENDGNYDKYGKGDVWVLVNKANEIDDGINCTTCTTSYIQIDPFVNGESTNNADIVVWYGAHYNHHDGANSPSKLIGDHVVGPDIAIRGY